jgi:hypothetical protein
MRTIVVQHDVQDLLARVASADPFEKRQELHPRLAAFTALPTSRNLDGSSFSMPPVGRKKSWPTAAFFMW